MRYVQDNAEESVRRVISQLNDAEFCYAMDDGSQICVKLTVDQAQRCATLDFTGTSPQHPHNLNAPTAITKAAVLYVFRCLVRDNIPLNEGCLKPLTIIIPEGSMLNPHYPAAVVAGNVETSQYIVDCLFGALSVMGAAQGTMNNVTWGNARYQYYETLCGGAGATANANGASAVHTHMTNSRLTDPEILETRFPVRLEEFSIRTHSGGQGRYQGGNGIVRKTRFLEPMTVSIVSGHRRIAPYGMAGGQAGLVGQNAVQRANGQYETLAGIAQVEMQADDILSITTPGGGGFGE
jgi:5-oxoprolinase (ATP-hydrolysing)